tara:strand:+ start:260 stop:589 length:330 start_codon:yes stop_codon:yes gene_type:complete
MAIKKNIKNSKSNLSSLSDKRGQMLIQIDALMEKINDQYGPFILDELQKRLEFTIEEFHDDLKIVLDATFNKHNDSMDASKVFSSNDDSSEVPAFIAEHQKKQKNKKRK